MQSRFLIFGLLASPALAADCTVFDELEGYPKTSSEPDGATCTLYLSETGSAGTSCHWNYPFRDAVALGFADAHWETLRTCRPGQTLEEDQPVNHPDSYALKEWLTQTAVYAISIKDKGRLNQTLVFLRFEPN